MRIDFNSSMLNIIDVLVMVLFLLNVGLSAKPVRNLKNSTIHFYKKNSKMKKKY